MRICYMFLVLTFTSSLRAIEYLPINSDVGLDERARFAELSLIKYLDGKIDKRNLRDSIDLVKDSIHKEYFEFYWLLEVENKLPTEKLLERLASSRQIESKLAVGLFYDSVNKLEEAKKYLCNDASSTARFYCARLLVEKKLNIEKGLSILRSIDGVDSLGVLGTYYCSVDDYKKCNDYFSRLPEDEDIVYFHNYGMNYFYGRGVEKNIDKAIYFFNKSKNAGHLDSNYALGLAYFELQNLDLAIKHLEEANLVGDHRATLMLGTVYSKSARSWEDVEKAFKYLELAGDHGLHEAYVERVKLNMALFRIYKDENYLVEAKRISELVSSENEELARILNNIILKSMPENSK